MKKKGRGGKFSRRQFIHQGVGFAVTAATVGCATGAGHRDPASAGADEEEFDYIVIGSGAGGGPVAVNLAKDPRKFRVLLLEAGDNSKNLDPKVSSSIDDPSKAPDPKKTYAEYPNYDVPGFHPLATDDPNMRWDFFVNHYRDPQRQQQDSKYVPGKGVLYPRAATVGGCTAHNAMITLYPDNQDWDYISQLFPEGSPLRASWGSLQMRKYYQRIERMSYTPMGLNLQDEKRGTNGWLSVELNDMAVRAKDLLDLKMHKIAIAGAGAFGAVAPKDANNWSSVSNNRPDGNYNIPKATSNGKRNGPRELINDALKKYPNLELRTRSLATRILFEGPEQRAVGLEYVDGGHVYGADPSMSATTVGAASTRRVRVKREIILSGGAFNSPQLLMLSGIGPQQELQAHGIEVRVDLPGVGQNLQDRYETSVVSKLTSEFQAMAACTWGVEGDPCLDAYNQDPKDSIYSSSGPIISLLKRSDPKRATPDLCIFPLPVYFRGYYPGWSKDCLQKEYMTWVVLKGHTNNCAGTVTLKSNNPLETPEINFNYFDEGSPGSDQDLNAVVAGLKTARTKNGDFLISQMVQKEETPNVPDQDLKDFVKREAWGHHASCTNKMGPATDRMAVVDGDFTVHGTKGLRVVDASVFPKIPGLFIAVPIYMIAEKASDEILATAAKTPV